MVAGVIGYQHGIEPAALGQANGYGKHDAVAEGYHRTLHIAFAVVFVGNIGSALENAALEVLPDEFEGNNQMLDAELPAVRLGAGGLRLILPCTVCKGDGKCNLAAVLVQQHRAVHSSRINK